MPQRKFRLEKNAPERLVVSWRGMWKDVHVQLDGQDLGEPFANFKALQAGRDFALPDGATLHVQFQKGGLGRTQALEVSRNGHPLPGSDADPRTQVKAAAVATWIIAALSTVFGVIGVSGVRWAEKLGFGWPSLAFGVGFGVLGYFILRRNRIALALVVALFAVDTILMLLGGFEAGGRLPTTGLVVRIFLFIPLINGFKAMSAADAVDRREDAADAF